MRLKDKVAIITGGARGIGQAIAKRYAIEGAYCIIADINIDDAQETVEEITGKGQKAMAVKLDVTKQDDIGSMVDTVVKKLGRIDILVNNAGVVEIQPLLEIEYSNWDRVFDVNAKGLFFVLQAVAKQMIKQGTGGQIINFASEAGQMAQELVLAYSATKAAVISITKNAAMELIKHKIRVNAISPGVVNTPMWDTVDELLAKYRNLPKGEPRRDTEKAVPYGRFGRPEDLEGIAVFLASDESEYMIGQTVNVDGGRVMK